jgi:hypothetical protein
VALLFVTLAREKDLEAKLAASSKAAKDAQARLAFVEAKCKKDVTIVETKATKAEKSLARAKRKNATREQVVVEHVDSLSMMFGSTHNFPVHISFFSIVGALY